MLRIVLLLGLASWVISAIALAESRAPAPQPASSAVSATTTATQEVRTTFTRGGQRANVECPPTILPSMELVLRAYGRVWATSSAQKQRQAMTAVFAIPALRVPTVFMVTHADRQEPILTHVVAYPDRDVPWNKETVLNLCGAPAWFEQWAMATGLPVTHIAPGDLPSARLPATGEKGGSVLIVGRAAAGGSPSDLMGIVSGKKVSVLVLDADWFPATAGPVPIAPAQMYGGLKEVGRQRWPQSLQFTSHHRPWPGIINRLAWIIDDNRLPLVEQIGLISAPHDDRLEVRTLIVSYLPWEEQLGRSEWADATLRAILEAAATAPLMSFDWNHGCAVSVWPAELRPRAGDVSVSRFTHYDQRPVLSSIAHGPPKVSAGLPNVVTILDLRGGQRLTDETRSALEKVKTGVLLLGDDKSLDDWDWLKLDRQKQAVGREGVVWLRGDVLPPPAEDQIKLMLTLTEMGVPLASPKQEEKKR